MTRNWHNTRHRYRSLARRLELRTYSRMFYDAIFEWGAAPRWLIGELIRLGFTPYNHYINEWNDLVMQYDDTEPQTRINNGRLEDQVNEFNDFRGAGG